MYEPVKFNIELDLKFTLHSLHRSRTLNLIEDKFQTITFSYTTQYAKKEKTKRKNKVGAFTTIFAVG